MTPGRPEQQRETFQHLTDRRHEALWDRLPGQKQRQIEAAFVESLGSDLICEAEEAASAGTAERFADLGRWLAASWLAYRNHRLDQLVSNGEL